MIGIIGAGPIGSYLAYLLAKEGKEVCVYEEHNEIGKPVHCSGHLSAEIHNVIKIPEELIVNRLKSVRVVSKHSSVELPIEDILIDRARFDQWIAGLAKSAGARFYLGYRFLSNEGKNVVLEHDGKREEIKVDCLIGADGANSRVAKYNGFSNALKHYIGMQARVKGLFKKDTFEVYFGSVCPGFFAWIIPESSTVAKMGVAGKGNVNAVFSRFLRVNGISEKEIIEKQGGLIPLYKNVGAQRGHVYVVGDAARQVKATTGGGLVPGLKAAGVLAKSILEGKDYKKGLGNVDKELLLHKIIRQMLDNFTDDDYDSLLKLMDQDKVKNILQNNNRDSAKKMVKSLVLAEPRFIGYLSRIII